MTKQLPKDADPLVVSYLSVRRAIGAVGLVLPILLGPVGWFVFSVPLQENMSSYYYTPLRDVFVGALCAIGIFLFCYRGYDPIEDWTANFGCLSALGLAFCPIDPQSDPLHQRSWTGLLHSASGGVFFLTLAVYSLYHFPTRGDAKREDAPHEGHRNFVYRTSGLVILVSLVAMGAYLFLIPTDWRRRCDAVHFLFWGEWVAVWAFAAAWLTKGRAILADIAVDLLSLPSQIFLRRTGSSASTGGPTGR